MEKKWRKLGIVLAVLIAIVAVYFLFFSGMVQPSFEEEYASLSSKWKEKGIDEDYFHSDTDKIISLTEGELKFLVSDFSESESMASNNSTKNVAATYSLLTNYILSLKKAEELNASLASSNAGFCESVSQYEELNQQLELIVSSSKELATKSNEFISNYPSEAESIDFGSFGYDFIVINDDLEQQIALFDLYKETCEGL